MDKRHELGRVGEDLASRHLESLGYKVLDKNLKNALGELDLVALDGETVVIVEVKTLARLGRSPADAVHFRKRRKLIQVATLFLQSRKWLNRFIRFDVVEVTCPPGVAPYINHIKNAFDAAD